MKILIAIISHNSKEFTQNIVNSLTIINNIDIIVVENSNLLNKKYNGSCKIDDFGPDNIGYGGCIQQIIEKYSDMYDFIGLFNNDLINIPTNYCSIMMKYMKPEYGIVHSALIDVNCPYPQMIVNNNLLLAEVKMIENVCPFVSTKVLKEFKKYFPLHYYGWIDNELSATSLSLGLKNVVVHETNITHHRSAVRKMLEPINKNFTDYISNAEMTYNSWISKNPELKNIKKFLHE